MDAHEVREPQVCEPERIEPADGNPLKVGTITAAVPIKGARLAERPIPPPLDHPAWESTLVTPDDLRDAAGLVVARDMGSIHDQRKGR